jgi:hypothetical protein
MPEVSQVLPCGVTLIASPHQPIGPMSWDGIAPYDDFKKTIWVSLKK